MNRWLPANATVGHGDHGGACCSNCASGKACKAPCVSGRWMGTVDQTEDNGWLKVAAAGVVGLIIWRVLS